MLNKALKKVKSLLVIPPKKRSQFGLSFNEGRYNCLKGEVQNLGSQKDFACFFFQQLKR